MAVSEPRTISLVQARRIAVRAQLLEASSLDRDAGDLPAVVEQLTLLPLNPTDIVCPSAEHIARTRIPSLAYDDVRRAVEMELTLVEHLGPHRHPMEAWAIGLRATSDLPWLTAIGRDPDAIRSSARDWLEANDAVRERVLPAAARGRPAPPGRDRRRGRRALPYRAGGTPTATSP